MATFSLYNGQKNPFKDLIMSIILNKNLLLLVDIVHLGSFIAAANHNNMDASQLSKHIKQLEKQLNLRLINRSTRALSLTEAGEEIYQYALSAKQLQEQINAYAEPAQSRISGRVKIATAVSLDAAFIAPVVSRLNAKYPLLFFEIVYDEAHTDIIKHAFDIAIRVWNPADSNLIGQKLYDVKPILVASADFIQAHGKPQTIEELLALPAICYGRGTYQRNKIKYREDETVKTANMQEAYRLGASEALLNHVKKGQHYTLLFDYMAQADLQNGSLVQLLPQLPLLPEETLYALYPSRHTSKGTKLFLQAMRAHCQSCFGASTHNNSPTKKQAN